VSFVPKGMAPAPLQQALAGHGIFAWAGHSYAVALCEALDLLPHGVLRLGLLHYATAAEVDRVLETLAQLVACTKAETA
jgi:selenocysteine lyase/cysteine desulfurase